MAKSLGQIHTVNYKLNNVAVGDLGLIDLPGRLSTQLQHRVRMMSTFKITGIDCAIVSDSGASAISASLQYYAPTRGRVAALKEAWQACKAIFNAQGIRYWNNLNYDFRPPIRSPTAFNLDGALGSDFLNQASIEQIAGVNEPLCLSLPPAGAKAVFAAYNESVGPLQTAAPTFTSGFATLGTTTAGDMVLNEGVYLQSRVPIAEEALEEIPLQLSFDELSDTASTTFMWRPDPALYLSVLCGQFIFKVDESSEPSADIDLNFHVAGWKSIFHHDRKRKRKASSSKRKSHGRKKRHSKK